MKISCTQENLNQGLFVVSHLVSKNVTLPILNNILFKVDDNSIKLLADQALFAPSLNNT